MPVLNPIIPALQQRVKAAEVTVYLAFMAGILMSFRLWVSDRMFPMAPVIDDLSPYTAPFDHIMAYLLLALLAINCYVKKPWLNIAFFFLLWLLLIRDQTRWQAWVYMYLLAMIPFTLRSKFDNGTILQYLRLLLIGVYLWSGIHKINPTFTETSFRLMVTGLFKITEPRMVEAILPYGNLVPAIEIMMAVFLFFPKTRLAGLVLAVSSHILILFFVSPLGTNYNSVIIPWNIAMIALAIVAFYKTRDRISLARNGKFSWQLFPVCLLVGLMPVFNFFGYWDNSLSFLLYANKEERMFVAISDTEIPRLPPPLKKYLIVMNSVGGGKALDVHEWCMGELNVPVNHERRVFKHIAHFICSMGLQDRQFYFMLMKQKGKEIEQTNLACYDFID